HCDTKTQKHKNTKTQEQKSKTEEEKEEKSEKDSEGKDKGKTTQKTNQPNGHGEFFHSTSPRSNGLNGRHSYPIKKSDIGLYAGRVEQI
ncbi:MAG: hypothetical protein KKD59_01130, partial [Acidobacteria bacterium]|nr:hypothetical protein [Acidobacteriota bacterium]